MVKKAVKLAREDRYAFEDEYLLPFELELPVTAMFTAMAQLENNLTAIETAQIEVVTRPSARPDPCIDDFPSFQFPDCGIALRGRERGLPKFHIAAGRPRSAARRCYSGAAGFARG